MCYGGAVMSARRPSTFSNLGLDRPAKSAGRNSNAGVRGTKPRGASGWKIPTTDLRLLIGNLSERGRQSIKMLRNEGRSDYVYENTGTPTKCTPLKTASLHGNAPITP